MCYVHSFLLNEITGECIAAERQKHHTDIAKVVGVDLFRFLKPEIDIATRRLAFSANQSLARAIKDNLRAECYRYNQDGTERTAVPGDSWNSSTLRRLSSYVKKVVGTPESFVDFIEPYFDVIDVNRLASCCSINALGSNVRDTMEKIQKGYTNLGVLAFGADDDEVLFEYKTVGGSWTSEKYEWPATVATPGDMISHIGAEHNDTPSLVHGKITVNITYSLVREVTRFTFSTTIYCSPSCGVNGEVFYCGRDTTNLLAGDSFSMAGNVLLPEESRRILGAWETQKMIEKRILHILYNLDGLKRDGKADLSAFSAYDEFKKLFLDKKNRSEAWNKPFKQIGDPALVR